MWLSDEWGIFFFLPKKDWEGSPLIYFFFITEEAYDTDRLWIIFLYLPDGFIPFFKSRYSVLSDICAYEGVS